MTILKVVLTILHVLVLYLDETSPAGHAAPPIAPMAPGEGGEGERMERKEEGETVAAGDSQLPSTQDLFGGDSS